MAMARKWETSDRKSIHRTKYLKPETDSKHWNFMLDRCSKDRRYKANILRVFRMARAWANDNSGACAQKYFQICNFLIDFNDGHGR